MKKKSYDINTHIIFMYNHIFMRSDSFHLEKKFHYEIGLLIYVTERELVTGKIGLKKISR